MLETGRRPSAGRDRPAARRRHGSHRSARHGGHARTSLSWNFLFGIAFEREPSVVINSVFVMAGLVPAIPARRAPRPPKHDDGTTHDNTMSSGSRWSNGPANSAGRAVA